MRLKFRSLSLLDHQNMPKPIPHCSNFGKIIFLKKGQSNNLSANSYLMSTPNVDLLHWNLSWALTFINLLMRLGVCGGVFRCYVCAQDYGVQWFCLCVGDLLWLP